MRPLTLAARSRTRTLHRHPVGDDAVLTGEPAGREGERGRRHGDAHVQPLLHQAPEPHPAVIGGRFSIAAWNVPTTGDVARSTAEGDGALPVRARAGCRTGRCGWRGPCASRSWVGAEIGAGAVGRDGDRRPHGDEMLCARWRGCPPRVAKRNAPTGAMIQRSCPRSSSSSARCSMCWFTPPGTVHEYGDTSATRMAAHSFVSRSSQKRYHHPLARVGQAGAGRAAQARAEDHGDQCQRPRARATAGPGAARGW